MNFIDIGAAIIVRNGEQSIINTLESLRGICRQVAVVDTGSDDSTPSICTRHGAELHFFNWNDNFSDARNYALKLMRTKWVLVIDADEELDMSSFVNSINSFENERTGGLRVRIDSPLPDNTIKSHYYPRIFRNNKDFRFEGRIHEQISQSIIDAGYNIEDSEIIIYHSGYSDLNEEKIERNTTLLSKEIEDNPNDDFTKYHLAETHFAAMKLEEAFEIFSSIIGSQDLSSEQNDMIRIRMAQISLKFEDFETLTQLTQLPFNNIDIEGLRIMIIISTLLLQHKFDEVRDLINSPALYTSNLVDRNNIQIIKSTLNIF